MKSQSFMTKFQSALRDLDLLEQSLCDLALALGGRVVVVQNYYQTQLEQGAEIEQFFGVLRRRRVQVFYSLFRRLRIPVDAFFRILQLHVQHGRQLLEGNSQQSKADVNFEISPFESIYIGVELVSDENARYFTDPSLNDFLPCKFKIFCSLYLDAIYDLYSGVLKRSHDFSLCECVRMRGFFVELDKFLTRNGLRHLHIRNEIYDLILHSLWFSLKDAWWIYVEPEWLKRLLPFLGHIYTENLYSDVSIEELSIVLSKIGKAIDFSEKFSSEPKPTNNATQVFNLSDNESDAFDYINFSGDCNTSDRVNTSNYKTPNYNRIEYIQYVDNLGVDRDEYDEIDEYLKGEGLGSSDPYCGWSDSLRAAMVGTVYIVLFESFIRRLSRLEYEERIEILLRHLETLDKLSEIVQEVDCSYTAWAVDLLGPRADEELLTAFRFHERRLFGQELPRGCEAADDVKGQVGATRLFILSGALSKVDSLYRKIVVKVIGFISAPVVREIRKSGKSQLWWQLLYSRDKLLIGPHGKVSGMLKNTSSNVRIAICVELYSRIITEFLRRSEFIQEDDETRIFNSLAIWDSLNSNLRLSDIKKTPQIGKLFEIIEKVKMGLKIKEDEPWSCIVDFWSNRCCDFSSLPISLGGYQSESQFLNDTLTLEKYAVAELCASVGPGNYAWIDGSRRKRIAIFGGLLLFFRDNSTLQPVGILDCHSVSAVICPFSLHRQSHLNFDVPDEYSEYHSCGTTESDVQSLEEFTSSCASVKPCDTHLLYWGWRLRLELFGVFGFHNNRNKLETPHNTDYEKIDLEFLGPQHREKWSKILTKLQPSHTGNYQGRWEQWWPKYSIFL